MTVITSSVLIPTTARYLPDDDGCCLRDHNVAGLARNVAGQAAQGGVQGCIGA